MGNDWMISLDALFLSITASPTKPRPHELSVLSPLFYTEGNSKVEWAFITSSNSRPLRCTLKASTFMGKTLIEKPSVCGEAAAAAGV